MVGQRISFVVSHPPGFGSAAASFDPQDVIDGFGDGMQMADCHDEPVAACLITQHCQGRVECGGVEGCEAFIEEQRAEARQTGSTAKQSSAD